MPINHYTYTNSILSNCIRSHRRMPKRNPLTIFIRVNVCFDINIWRMCCDIPDRLISNKRRVCNTRPLYGIEFCVKVMWDARCSYLENFLDVLCGKQPDFQLFERHSSPTFYNIETVSHFDPQFSSFYWFLIEHTSTSAWIRIWKKNLHSYRYFQ